MNKALMTTELIRDEGNKPFVYDDATGLIIKPGTTVIGHPTVGTGRALDVRGLTPAESQYLLSNDIDSVTLGCHQAWTWFNNLDEVRQRVIVNMAFNMGINGVHGFPAMIAAITAKDYDKAAFEMENSAWFGQVGQRAVRLVKMMRTGAVG